jgi:hypothetical protein
MKALRGVRTAIGALLVAAALYALLAAPGFLSDQASTVALRHVQESRR